MQVPDSLDSPVDFSHHHTCSSSQPHLNAHHPLPSRPSAGTEHHSGCSWLPSDASHQLELVNRSSKYIQVWAASTPKGNMRAIWCLCILALIVGSNARFLHHADSDKAAVTGLVKKAAARSSGYKNTEVCCTGLI